MYRLKLHQIIRLCRALLRWRRLAHKPEQISSSSLRPWVSRSSSWSGAASGHLPAGHLAVYVGSERERFVIKTSVLGHPLFKALLKKSEEEMGFHYEGGLTIPCQVSAFQRLLHLIASQGKPGPAHLRASSPEMASSPAKRRISRRRCIDTAAAAAADDSAPHGFHQFLQELAGFHIKEISSHLRSSGRWLPESATLNSMQKASRKPSMAVDMQCVS